MVASVRSPNHGAGVGHQKRVAIGRGFGNEIRAYGATCTWFVVYDYWLAENFGELIRKHACMRVEGATGGKADDDLDGLFRKGRGDLR